MRKRATSMFLPVCELAVHYPAALCAAGDAVLTAVADEQSGSGA